MEEQKSAKVTLYLPPDLHRKLKIRSAVDGEAMSSIAKRAIDFYLANSGVVEEGLQVQHGNTYRIYDCPSCSTPVVLQQGELVEIAQLSRGAIESSSAIDNPDLCDSVSQSGALGEGELVVC